MLEEIKKILKEYREDTKKDIGNVREDLKKDIGEVKKHIDVLKEDWDSKFDLLVEGHKALEERLDSHTEMIGEMKVNIEIIKDDVEIIKTSLRKKVDLEDFELLEKRVGILETKVK